MGSEPSLDRARPRIPQAPRTSMPTNQLAARLLEFDALVSSELRKRPADIVECSDDDVSDQGVCEPLVIGWNHIPRSMVVARGRQRVAVDGHILPPPGTLDQGGG